MVKAILDGRKTVTRRVLADRECLGKKHALDREPYKFRTGEWRFDKQTAVDDYKTYTLKPRYQPGSVLYVRETWAYGYESYLGAPDWESIYIYKADGKPADEIVWDKKWKPSIHMPKEAARIFLRVTDIRVERLQDITYEGCKAEGLDGLTFEDDIEGLPSVAMRRFERMWNKTIRKKDMSWFGWDANPWVWVIEFERTSADQK